MEIEWLFMSMILFMPRVIADSTSSNNAKYYVLAQRYTKYISSPNYPLKYPSNYDVFYTIKTEEETNSRFYLELKWLEFDVKGDTKACNDFVQIRYKSHPNQTYVFCSTRRPHTLYSVEGDLEMHFHSDKSVVGYGFKIAFQLVPFTQTIGQASCRNEIKLGKSAGILSSVRWPVPINHSSCVYTITLKEDEVLQINIMDFSMRWQSGEVCNNYNNFIEIRGTDENKPFTESCPIRFLSSCGGVKSWTIEAAKRKLFIHVNIMEIYRDQRGFLAGFSINTIKAKSVLNVTNPDNQKKNESVSDAVMIGAIAGIIIGIAIVLLTIFSVSVCMKRRII